MNTPTKNRSILSLNGWDPNSGSTYGSLPFKNYNTESVDLTCMNVTDQFSVSNEKAKLTYPVGLMSFSEINLPHNKNVQRIGTYYWTLSPYYYRADTDWVLGLPSGAADSYVMGAIINNNYGARPAISLKANTEYISGDGSMGNPYYVPTD